MTWGFAVPPPPDGPPGKVKTVLLALCNRCDHETGRCFPSKTRLDLLAREASVPRRTLVRYLEALIRNGYVRREKGRTAGGQQAPNVYYIVFDRDPQKYGKWQWKRAASAGAEIEPGDDLESEADEAADEATETAEPSAMVAPDQATQPSATVAPGAECQGGTRTECQIDRVPSAIGGTLYNSPINQGDLTYSSEHISPPPGFSKKAQEAEVAAERIEQAAAKANARIFVFKGSDAWNAWCEYRRRRGEVPSLPTTTTEIDGNKRYGWWMPSLWPPRERALGDAVPPEDRGLMSAADEDFIKQGGMR